MNVAEVEATWHVIRVLKEGVTMYLSQKHWIRQPKQFVDLFILMNA